LPWPLVIAVVEREEHDDENDENDLVSMSLRLEMRAKTG
jgi:hypothetical protein